MLPLDAALAPFRNAYAARFDPLPAGAIGVISPAVPLELILAAGLTPRRVFPDPRAASSLADAYMEPVFDGAIRSLFEHALQGKLEQMPMLVISRYSEGYLQLYYFLQEAARWRPDLNLPALHLFDLLKTPNWSTRGYVRDQLVRLQSALGALTGRPIEAPAVQAAIHLLNRQRHLMAQIGALRRSPLAPLSGGEVLQIIGAAGVMSPASHMAAMEALLASAASRPVPSGPRVMVKGSAHDDLRFYELVEACGAVIVADDHATGEPVFSGQVDEEGSPLDVLARHYHRTLPTARSYPQAAEDERSMNSIIESQIDGVIFFLEEHDDTLGWDYPSQKKRLDARGIPSIRLLQQSYRTPDERSQREALQPWLKSFAASAARANGRFA